MTTDTDTLPMTNDIDALYHLAAGLGRPMLYQGHGDTRELMASNAPRMLRVWWDDMGPDDEGWSWETKRRGDRDSGALDSATELGELLVWVDGERADRVAGEAG